jgi:nucleoside-diphosphate-sugar epimerase
LRATAGRSGGRVATIPTSGGAISARSSIAPASPPTTPSVPAATVEAHASLLGRVLEGARYESLVYLSSTRLYDSLGGVEATEDDAAPPRSRRPSPSLRSLEGARRVAVPAAGRGRARVARLSCVWSGASDDSGFLSTLIRDALARRAAADPALRQRLQVNSSPRLERDYVHIDDVLAALVSLARHDGFGIYNVAGGRNVANDELFDLHRCGERLRP